MRGPASDDGNDASLLDEAVHSGEENEVQEIQQVYGMVTGKVRGMNWVVDGVLISVSVQLVLAVLRGSAAEKSAEKCYLQFVEGVEPSLQLSEEDSIETRLLLKLQYKHGTRTYLFSSLSYSALIWCIINQTERTSALQRCYQDPHVLPLRQS